MVGYNYLYAVITHLFTFEHRPENEISNINLEAQYMLSTDFGLVSF